MEELTCFTCERKFPASEPHISVALTDCDRVLQFSSAFCFLTFAQQSYLAALVKMQEDLGESEA